MEYLLGGALVVSERVGGVLILVEDVRVWDLRVQLLGDANVALGSVPSRLGGRADDLRAERLKHVHLLIRHLLGQRDDDAISANQRSDREADASVAGRGLNKRVSGLDAPRLFGVENHALADSVLDRPASVEELAFGQDLALVLGAKPVDGTHPSTWKQGVLRWLWGSLVDPDERCVSDVVERTVGYLRARPVRWQGRARHRGGIWTGKL